MAATSGVFNLVKLTEIRYADVDVTATVAPTTELKIITSADVLEGTLTINVPAKSTTPQFNEDGNEVYNYGAPVSKTIELGLPNSLMSTVVDFLEGTLTAGSAGVTPASIDFDGTPAANKYIEVEGLNSEGEVFTAIAYNAKISSAFTGKMGAGQALVPLTVIFNALWNKGMGKCLTLSSEF